MGAITSGIGSIVGGVGSIYSGYQAKAAADSAADAAMAEAQAQSKIAQEQASQANAQAGIAQQQAEEEAEKRSRLLASDIGSAYANWAGNGLSVSGNPGDTFGSILNTQVAEGVADINTIRDNGAIKVWTYQNQAKNYSMTSKYALLKGENTASSLSNQGNAALTSGWFGGVSGMMGGTGSILDGGEKQGWWKFS